MDHLDVIGGYNLCFETDYPHADSSWPRSVARALEITEGLPEPQREKVLRFTAPDCSGSSCLSGMRGRSDR